MNARSIQPEYDAPRFDRKLHRAIESFIDSAVRMRARVDREDVFGVIDNPDAMLARKPFRLCARELAPVDVEPRCVVLIVDDVVEPSHACIGMRFGIRQVWLDVEYRRAVEEIDIGDAQRPAAYIDQPQQRQTDGIGTVR